MARFIDEVELTLVSGRGGDGAVSFRREKYAPKGGPDGGDGGRGGDVVFAVKKGLRTLHDLKTRNVVKARNGKPGEKKERKGADGEGVVVSVPPGTVIIDPVSGALLADLVTADDVYTAVRGGRGGFGNTHFKTSTNQAPRYSQKGGPPENLRLRLQLKVIADIGIVGLPNAGKSTLLSVLTSAKPKIAGYPFTTLSPNLGVMRFGNESEYVIADIPGLIEGASTGQGLGIQFLRHVERTKAIVYLLDLLGDPEQDYKTLLREMENYSGKLLEKPRLIVGSKRDAVGDGDEEAFLKGPPPGKLTVSAVTGRGVGALKREIVHLMENREDDK